MIVMTHTLSFRLGEKDILAFKGLGHDDGTAHIDIHGAGLTVHAEWSMSDLSADASADGTIVNVSVNSRTVESLTMRDGVLMGPSGPWEPTLEHAPVSVVTEGQAPEVTPETGSTLGGAIGGAIGGFIGGLIGGAIGKATGGSKGAKTGSSIGSSIGSAIGSAIGSVIGAIFQ